MRIVASEGDSERVTRVSRVSFYVNDLTGRFSVSSCASSPPIWPWTCCRTSGWSRRTTAAPGSWWSRRTSGCMPIRTPPLCWLSYPRLPKWLTGVFWGWLCESVVVMTGVSDQHTCVWGFFLSIDHVSRSSLKVLLSSLKNFLNEDGFLTPLPPPAR